MITRDAALAKQITDDHFLENIRDLPDWVEIYNPSDSIFNMSQWVFKDEADDHIYTIPEGTNIDPNQYLILCRDTILFKNHFPNVNSYVGNLDFGLSGGGELIRLYNNNGIIMDS